MNYIEHMKKVINYMEENLQSEIDLAACAKIGGYSRYHFLRLFKYVTGITPADYIRKRRVSEIAKLMMEKDDYISEFAFQYGFNSKENFIRAFKKEHHILPSEYKSKKNSLRLYDRFSFEKRNFIVPPDILKLKAFKLVTYKSDEKFTPNFWNKYNAKEYSRILSGGNDVCDYGACVWNGEKNQLDYYIGIKKEDAKGNLQDTFTLEIKGGLYAKFSTPPSKQSDFVNTIHATWDYINNTWRKKSEYEFTDDYQFECYIESSHVFSEDIYIPIKRK